MDIAYELKRKREDDDQHTDNMSSLDNNGHANNNSSNNSIINTFEPQSKRQQITRKFQSTRRHDSIPNIIQLSKHIARVSFLELFKYFY